MYYELLNCIINKIYSKNVIISFFVKPFCNDNFYDWINRFYVFFIFYYGQ